MKEKFIENGIEYVRNGDHYIPNLTVPDVEYMKDPLSRDIPSVDNSLFILARKLILS